MASRLIGVTVQNRHPHARAKLAKVGVSCFEPSSLFLPPRACCSQPLYLTVLPSSPTTIPLRNHPVALIPCLHSSATMRHSTSHRATCALYLSLLAYLPSSAALHHMKRELPDHVRRATAGTKPLVVTNKCPETIYPAFITQEGTGPAKTGFELKTGAQVNQTVSANWQGRVWGRTNCTFPANGPTACSTGDCNGQVECTVSVRPRKCWPPPVPR